MDTSLTIVIVVGAHPRAEAEDRPVAAALRRRVRARLAGSAPQVCTDLWYLNDAGLRRRPTISIGHPGVNALTAYMADKVPAALSVEGELCVQVDPDFTDLVALCWGRHARATAAAVDAFTSRYLGGFLAEAARSA